MHVTNTNHIMRDTFINLLEVKFAEYGFFLSLLFTGKLARKELYILAVV